MHFIVLNIRIIYTFFHIIVVLMVFFPFVFSCFSGFSFSYSGKRRLHLSLFYGNEKYCQRRVLFACCCEKLKLMYQITFIVSLLIKTHICDITRISDLFLTERGVFFLLFNYVCCIVVLRLHFLYIDIHFL